VSLKINPSHKTDIIPKARPMPTLNQEKGYNQNNLVNIATKLTHTPQVRLAPEI
jgi:hypothetical protein